MCRLWEKKSDEEELFTRNGLIPWTILTTGLAAGFMVTPLKTTINDLVRNHQALQASLMA